MPEPTRIEKLGSFEIHIYDNLLSEEAIKRHYAILSHADFTFLHASREDTITHREWMADFSIEDFRSHSLHALAEHAAKRLSGSDPLNCYNVFCNASSFGDMTFVHNDSTNHSDISTLYYANAAWDAEWGGETIFFTDDLDARLAISILPGRLIAFMGGLKHRAGVPTKICSEVRLTLSMRFEVPGNA